MNIKFYDLLSSVITGVAIFTIVNNIFLNNIEINEVAYLAIGYLIGYFINAIGSRLEGILYKTIGGKPSDRLLTPIEDQKWTGYRRVKFHSADEVISMLKQKLKESDASTEKMFECAMRMVNGDKNSRVPDFNAQYALSRTVLTTTLLAVILLAFRFYDCWLFWVVGILLLLISWNRFKERAYYYAREVLNEYMKKTKVI